MSYYFFLVEFYKDGNLSKRISNVLGLSGCVNPIGAWDHLQKHIKKTYEIKEEFLVTVFRKL
jgi:hypothetical protein